MSEGTEPTKTFHQTVGPESEVEQALETAPVIYVDGAQGFASSTDGVVRLNLYQDKLTIHPEGTKKPFVTRSVCARLVMSMVVLEKLHEWLGEQLAIVSSRQDTEKPDAPTDQ